MESNDVIPMTPKSTTKFGPTYDMAKFFYDCNYTPPAKGKGHGGELLMNDVMKNADDILEPWNESWDNFDKTKQVKLAFLIARRQHEQLKDAYHNGSEISEQDVASKVAETFLAALDERSVTGRRLEVFVCKDGDVMVTAADKTINEKLIEEGSATDPFEAFLDEHPEWRDSEKAYTLFNQSDFHFPLQPIYRYQDPNSSLCYAVASALMLFYSLYRASVHRGETHEEACKRLSLNVSRFMRNHFSNEDIYLNIFLGQGGYPNHVIESLLRPFAKPNVALIATLPLKYLVNLSGDIFEFFKGVMDDAGPILLGCESFPALADPNDLFLHDDLSAPALWDTSCNHCMVIVGARPSYSQRMGAVEFLVQHTLREKPFLVLGLNLLRRLNVQRFFIIEKGLDFDVGENCHDGSMAQAYYCGSPCALEDGSACNGLDDFYDATAEAPTKSAANSLNDRQLSLACFEDYDPNVRVSLFPPLKPVVPANCTIPQDKAGNG